MKNINESEIEGEKMINVNIYIYIFAQREYNKKDTNRFSFIRFLLND